MDPWNTLGTIPKSLNGHMGLPPKVEMGGKIQGSLAGYSL